MFPESQKIFYQHQGTISKFDHNLI